ncbi:MAG: MotE family protein [Kiloniellales bacterium]
MRLSKPRVRLLPLLIVTAGLVLFGRAIDLSRLFAVAAQAEPSSVEQTPDETASGDAPAADGEAMTGEDESQEAAGPATETTTEPTALPIGSGDPLFMSDQELEILQSLAERRTEIDRRLSEVERRETLLKAAEARIDEKVGELKALQASIEGLVAKHDEQSAEQLDSLVKIYQTMKPKDAARIFEQLDMGVLLSVVDRMNERKAAPILAEMNPEKAKAITLELAQRRQLPIAKN